MQFWNSFAAKHPATAKWVREGGLFVIVSNLITVLRLHLSLPARQGQNRSLLDGRILGWRFRSA